MKFKRYFYNFLTNSLATAGAIIFCNLLPATAASFTTTYSFDGDNDADISLVMDFSGEDSSLDGVIGLTELDSWSVRLFSDESLLFEELVVSAGEVDPDLSYASFSFSLVDNAFLSFDSGAPNPPYIILGGSQISFNGIGANIPATVSLEDVVAGETVVNGAVSTPEPAVSIVSFIALSGLMLGGTRKARKTKV